MPCRRKRPAQTIITDFSRELNNAWHQLRELLTTFRLTQPRHLPAALQESLDSLQSQTQEAKISTAVSPRWRWTRKSRCTCYR
jgi:two-component system nitrate/nitrite sensor histidine kinase NarQ